MCGRHCWWPHLKAYSQFQPSHFPAMEDYMAQLWPTKWKSRLVLSEKPLFFWPKKGVGGGEHSLVRASFFIHLPSPNFLLPDGWMWCREVQLPACSSEAARMRRSQEFGVMQQKAGRSQSPWWQAHLQILCCVRKIMPICLFLSRVPATCGWLSL